MSDTDPSHVFDTNSNLNLSPTSLIHPRREPFEHGFLPIPKLIAADLTQTLMQFKAKLGPAHHVDSATLTDSIQISLDLARLIVDMPSSVLHSEADPLVKAKPEEIEMVGADLCDLRLCLDIQLYKGLLPGSHKDSAAVADVGSSISAIDGGYVRRRL